MQNILAVFAVTVVLVYVLRAGTKWALHGDGYWPRGVLGVVLAIVLVIGVPYSVLVGFRAIKTKKPIYWVVPPLHNGRSLP